MIEVLSTEVIPAVLLAYIALFLLSIAFLSYRVKKQTGVFPIINNKDRGVYGFVGKIVLCAYALIIANTLLYTGGYVTVYSVLDLLSVKLMGLLLITVALVCMYRAQLQMGKSWRIGIDSKNKVDLVETGFFRYMRHPIYFFAVLIGLGMLFIIPNTVSVLIVFIVWIVLSVQARLEEEYMLSAFGETYRAFKNTRRRFF